MNPLKQLAGETALYGVSSIIGRFLNYLLFPLHTYIFPTGDYGIITELYVYVAFLNIIYLYGLETAYFRYAGENPKNEGNIFNTGITSVLITTLIFSTAIIVFATPIVNFMGYHGQEHFVYIFAGIMAFDAFFALPYARLRREGRAKRFAATKIFGIGINIGVNLFFLLFCYKVYNGDILPGFKSLVNTIYNPSYNLEYVFLANLAGSSLVVLFLYRELLRSRLSINWEQLKKMLVFGYPLIFSGLALVINEKLSLAALKYWLPEDFYPGFSNQQILGIYGGVFKLSILMNLGIQAYRYAAEPFFFNQGYNKESPKLFSKLLTWFVLVGCVLWMGVTFNLDILQYLLRQPDYRIAIDVVPVLLLSSLFMGINYNLSAWYKLIDMTKAGIVITVIGALITIVGNYLLIPHYGYFGSAYAAVTAYIAMTLISYFWGQRKNPFPYEVGKILFYIAITLLIIYGAQMIAFDSTFLNLFIKNGIIIVYLIVIYLVEFKKRRTLSN